MKKYSTALIGCVLIFGAVGGGYLLAESNDPTRYSTYETNLKEKCEVTASTQWNRKDYASTTLISTTGKKYPKIEDFQSNNEPEVTKDIVENAAEIYKNNMNRIYRCAVLNTQNKVLDALLNSNGVSRLPGSNTIDALKRLHESVKDRMSGEGEDPVLGNQSCKVSTYLTNSDTPSPDGKDITTSSFKPNLLNDATRERCRFEYYMLYLQANAAQNTQIFLKQETDPSDSNRERNITIANAATTLASISVRIQSELSHARSTHEKAFNAYSEFEKTYAQHVVLQIIYDDYIQLRKNLRDVMNPLSQLIYKHNNSTNQYDN